MEGINISLSAENIFHIGGFAVSNSLLVTWIVMGFLILFAVAVRMKLSLVPGKLQSISELLIGGFYSLFASINGENIKLVYPLLLTLFIYIIISNWLGLFPGFGTIGFPEVAEGRLVFVPLLRGPMADLNTTFALAIVAMFSVQYFGIQSLGAHYFSKFFNFKNPIYFFVGILEFVLEGAKVVSFAFRLFGNVFAGEVLLTVIAFLMPVFAPLPFLGLELFVGFIQALVFSMLASVFLSLAMAKIEH